MLTYVYLVKCPNCEDEYFDFFDEAKEYALSCMSKKPIITQTEVTRNDFGECADHCDLGTVWSWEEAMKDTEGGYTDAEPIKSIFTKDDLKLMADGKDPEFDNLDNSVDVEITEDLEHIQYCPSCGTVNDYTDSQDNGSFIRYTCRDCNNTWDIDKPRMPAIESVEATDRKLISLVQDSIKGPLADRVGSSGFYSENGQRFMAIPVSTNSDAYDFESYKKELQQVFPNTDIYCVMDDSEIIIDVTSFYSERKPIPEGMTIEQLVEEMEENEDTVECTKCGGLFEKARCTHNKEGFGWCCTNCEPANTLIEDIQEEYDLAALVTDSINHLTNDLGKDPLADDFADDIIADIENNYDIEVPDVPEKYRDWASAIACEVSRQVNKSESASMLEELEDAKDYRKRLELCPECGTENSFDHETGFCLECGFNL
jgi:NADH pyrophosphatase NudC (nudix superfamily)